MINDDIIIPLLKSIQKGVRIVDILKALEFWGVKRFWRALLLFPVLFYRFMNKHGGYMENLDNI